MQNSKNCYENVWILSGTSDGPVIANRLLKLNYSVFASVLTYRAEQAYIKNSKLHIITGKLHNKEFAQKELSSAYKISEKKKGTKP